MLLVLFWFIGVVLAWFCIKYHDEKESLLDMTFGEVLFSSLSWMCVIFWCVDYFENNNVLSIKLKDIVNKFKK